MMIFPAAIITVKATISCPLDGENNLPGEARERERVGKSATGKDNESTLNPCLSQQPPPPRACVFPPARDPRCVPADDARPQAAALVRGNRFTAGTTGSYLHKLAEKHLQAGYSIVSKSFFSALPPRPRKKRKRKKKRSWPSLRVKS